MDADVTKPVRKYTDEKICTWIQQVKHNLTLFLTDVTKTPKNG